MGKKGLYIYKTLIIIIYESVVIKVLALEYLYGFNHEFYPPDVASHLYPPPLLSLHYNNNIRRGGAVFRYIFLYLYGCAAAAYDIVFNILRVVRSI